MTRPRIAFIGNCQAQAFQSLSLHLGYQVDIVLVPPVWRLTEEDIPELDEKLSSCDHIFKQKTDAEFKVAYLRDDQMRARFGERVIVWPNIYFDGYFPEIRYMYGTSGKIEGPLIDYHFDWMIDAWKRRASVEETATIATDPAAWRGMRDIVEDSIDRLKKREQSVDVAISDYIRDRFRVQKLFHSMNHPSTPLLTEMLLRLMERSGIGRKPVSSEGFRFSLDQIEIPPIAFFARRYRPIFDVADTIKGRRVVPETNMADPEATCVYSWPELIEEYFRLYERIGLGA